MPKRWYLRSFLPVTITAFFALSEPIFALMNAKNVGIYAFFKNRRS